MADLIGFISIALVFFLVFMLSLRWQDISEILYAAFFIRIAILLIGHYVIPLPDSTADAASIEGTAWKIAKNGFYNLSDYYEGPDAHFIRWFLAVPYILFGRSILMAQTIGILFGVLSVFVCWKLAIKLWNKDIAKKVGWSMALFPSLILYSVLTLREVYASFFLIIAFYGIVSWAKKYNFKSILLATVGFTGSIFFHGATIFGGMLFIIIIGFVSFKEFLKSLINYRINLKILFVLSTFIILFAYYLSNKISVPYLNDFEFASNLKNLMEKTRLATMGTAAYPEWTIISNPIEFLYKVPIRSFYFTFSPFPWDIKQISHLIGSIDSILYICLALLILKNIKVIWKDPALRIILIILLGYLIIFGVGVGNFGTGIRHRSKFTFLFILLAAPMINKLVFSKKQNKL